MGSNEVQGKAFNVINVIRDAIGAQKHCPAFILRQPKSLPIVCLSS
jgi:hypothetical protein